jgi:hypothetical protein
MMTNIGRGALAGFLVAVAGFTGCTSSGGGGTGGTGGGAGRGGAGAGASGNGGSSGATDGAADNGGSTGQAGADAGTAGDSGVAGSASSTDAGGQDGVSATMATLFVPDDIDEVVYRYNISQGGDAVYSGAIPTSKAYAVALNAAGELFVGSYAQMGTVSRFLSPLDAPVPNGTISGVGLVYPDVMTFVDEELWVPGTAPDCGTEAATLVRLGFDAQGHASMAGTIPTGTTGATRGMAWSAATRDLYVSQCGSPGAVQHFRVANDHSLSPLSPPTSTAMYNPAGVVVSPWGELFITSEGTATTSTHGNTVLRFLVDAQGNPTANGSIQGNGMDSPTGIAFAPWGELFVGNNSNQSVSRFTFDATHAASANGAFKLIAAQNNAIAAGTAFITIVAGSSSGLPTDAGLADDGG